MRTKISVTREHIKNGHPNEPCNCPIALAISEKLNRESYASVDTPEFEIRQNGFLEKTKSFKTKKRLCDFISKFDENEPVKPFSFYLNIPKRFLK